ncbi:MAG: hypothetical protein HZC51_01310 [Nitrospirae bacterium]|nr:hypothetical protein [Nitrospirota bacterium]
MTNDNLTSALLAVPEGHTHLRLALTTKDGETVALLSEAAVAAIVRAYTTVKTHPVRRAVKLVSETPDGLKTGYAKDQLIEADVPDEDVVGEMTELLEGTPSPQPLSREERG